jgi:hypothetical protein
MTQYDNTNRGVLFDNERKETDNHPDMTGKLNVNGVDHWFSAWWKKDRNDNDFLSLSLGKEVEQRQEQRRDPQRTAPQQRGNRPGNSAPQQRQQPARQSSGFDDMNDDIPW